jgi:hypothetical protein
MVLLNFVNAGGERNPVTGPRKRSMKKMAEDRQALNPLAFRTFRNYGKV